MENAMEESSRLAAAPRTAPSEVQRLDRVGHPVHVSLRDQAQQALERALPDEHAYWEKFENCVNPS